ncbi:hypothetical protein ACFOG5_19910 [Pedobacter fastidiosus]
MNYDLMLCVVRGETHHGFSTYLIPRFVSQAPRFASQAPRFVSPRTF